MLGQDVAVGVDGLEALGGLLERELHLAVGVSARVADERFAQQVPDHEQPARRLGVDALLLPTARASRGQLREVPRPARPPARAAACARPGGAAPVGARRELLSRAPACEEDEARHGMAHEVVRVEQCQVIDRVGEVDELGELEAALDELAHELGPVHPQRHRQNLQVVLPLQLHRLRLQHPVQTQIGYSSIRCTSTVAKI